MFPSIDAKYTVPPEVANYHRDQAGLIRLKAELESSRNTFFYVIKQGAHFSYNRNMPPSELEKRPFGSMQDMGDRDEMVNSYDTVVRWACDDYLKRVYEICKDKDALVIYTSDHGQNLLDDARFVSTHCVTIDPNSEQANVPLLIMDNGLPKGAGDLHFPLRPTANAKASHFLIFPTLLRAMGYPEAFCAGTFGPGLFSDPPWPGRRSFFSGGIAHKNLGVGLGKPLMEIGAPIYANPFMDRPAYCPPSP
jgi:lipid A ethanolaminephosphotransferase